MLRAALRMLGVGVDPAILSGVSSAAFRTYWPILHDGTEETPGWDEETPSVCGFDCLAAASEACGWRLLRYRDAPSHVAFQFVMQAIARRQPVLSYGLAGEPEEVLILGCDRTETTRALLVLTRHDREPVRFDLVDGPWPGMAGRGTSVSLFSPVPQHQRRTRENEIQRSLRRAVWLARTSDLAGRKCYRSGLAAYDAWIEALVRPGEPVGARAAADRLAGFLRIDLPEETRERELIGVRHVLHRTLSEFAAARTEAAAFVRAQAALFDTGPAAQWLEREADALTQAAALWPPVVAGAADGTRFAPSPGDSQLRLQREETVRCLRVAAGAHEEAIRGIEDGVPPTEQELLGLGDPEGGDANDDEGPGGG
jgi:hypothetical protein